MKKNTTKKPAKQTKKLGTKTVAQKKGGAVKTGIKAGYIKW